MIFVSKSYKVIKEIKISDKWEYFLPGTDSERFLDKILKDYDIRSY